MMRKCIKIGCGLFLGVLLLTAHKNAGLTPLTLKGFAPYVAPENNTSYIPARLTHFMQYLFPEAKQVKWFQSSQNALQLAGTFVQKNQPHMLYFRLHNYSDGLEWLYITQYEVSDPQNMMAVVAPEAQANIKELLKRSRFAPPVKLVKRVAQTFLTDQYRVDKITPLEKEAQVSYRLEVGPKALATYFDSQGKVLLDQ